MPLVMSEQTFEIGVEFCHFCLQEADDDAVPVPYPDDHDPDGPLLKMFESRIDVQSGGHTHTATLVAQIWDAPPPPEPGAAWEAQGEADIFSATGELAFVVVGGAQLETLQLGAPDHRWAVRVYCKGRAEVSALAREGVPHGVEQYLMQVWPTTARVAAASA